MNNIIAIILARGGSKTIPRKNIKLLCGKPLIAYSIETALKTGLRVIVSTQDEEIASVSRQYGAEVLDRPQHLSGDNVSSYEVLKHDMLLITKEAVEKLK